MKKYKVGDTIYLKGTIVDSDCAQQYLIKPGDYTYGFWFNRDAIADLPEPVKPILPKKVADEISFAKSIKGVTFDDYIVRELIRSDYKDSATNKMIKSSDVPNVIEVLLNAWNNGYTVEEKKYNLVIGTDSRNNRVCVYHIADETRIDGFTLEHDLNSSQYQFTQAEIDKYNKDFWIKNIDLNNYKVEVKANED